MLQRLTQLLLLGYCIIHLIEATFIFNVTNTQKLLCHSCKGDSCEAISDDEDNIVACNKLTQLCWAGFVNQKPLRTCASRYCTPSGISLDSDVRIETCCRSNLCNSIPLPWSMWVKYYQTTSTSRPAPPPPPPSSPPPPAGPVIPTSRRPTTKKSTTPPYYIVNEIVNGEREDSVSSKFQLNASNPASLGINWDRIPYEKGVSLPVASISKLLLLVMPVLLVLLF